MTTTTNTKTQRQEIVSLPDEIRAAYLRSLRCFGRLHAWIAGPHKLGVLIFVLGFAVTSLSAQSTGMARVTHAPSVNGTVDGSVQQMLPESVTLNGGANITGDLLVPGTPTVRLNGNSAYAGTIDGTGSASPSNHQVTLNGNVSLRRVLRRTDAVALPTVSAPPQPAGTRSVNINSANESPGNFATLRNLTLNGNVGQFTIPAGTYGNFTANGGSGFTLGVAGGSTPAVYHFQNLNLNGQTQIQLLGPVVITVANGFSANGTVGTSANSAWLTLNVYSSGLTLNGGCNVYGTVNAPNGTVIVNGNSQLVGGLSADRLIVNGSGLLRLVTSGGSTAPVANSQTVSLNEDTPASVTLTGSASNGGTLTYTILSSPAHGSLSGTAPALTYTPAFDYNGADSFTFKVNDGQTDSSSATITLAVLPVNDRPVALAKSAMLAEDTSANVILSGTDVDGNSLTFSVVTAPTHGSLSGTAPNLVYTPAANYYGTDGFTYIASDGLLASTPATFSLIITPFNDAPTATAANYTVNEGVTLPITLTGVDVDGDALTFTVLTQPSKGTLSGTAPNLTYTPFLNTTALDSFTFRASDGSVPSAPATITVQVNNLNDAPVAQPQTVTTAEDTALAVTLSGSDPDGDAITYVVVGLPQHGTLSGTAPALTYTPDLNYHGPDSFAFRVRDTSLIDSNLATVSINVTPVNDAPVAATAPVTTDEDTAVAITLAATDVDSTILTFAVLTQPAHGTLTGTAPNFTYTPAENYFGPDSFTYKANDGSLDSATSTLAITVRPVNDAPVATAQSRTTAEDTPISVTLAGTDIEGSLLTFTIATPPARGTLTGTAPNVTYTPAANYNGADSFTFKVNDGDLDSTPATVSLTVTAVNDTAVATNQSFTQAQDTPVSFTLAATDVDGDALTYVVTTPPQNGTLSGTAPNFTYTPNFNFRGTDSLTFTANDGQATSNSATVTFVLSPVSHAPIANNQSATLPEDSPVAVTLTASDLDGDALTYEIVAQPSHGSLSGTAPNLTYTPALNYNGPDSFTFTAKDAALSSAVATVTLTITPVNDAPTAAAQSITLAEDTTASFTLAATDVDGNPLTYIFVTQPAHGTLTGTAPSLTYSPATNYNGTDSFNYKVRDGSVDSNVATVTFTITPVNDAPVAIAQSIATDEDSPLAIQLTATDIDSTTLTYVIVSPPQHGALTGVAPNFTYTPTADYSGPDNFTFKSNDGELDSTVATVSLTVRPVNDRPVANAQLISTGVATPVAVTLTGSDVEGSPLTFAVVASPQHGTLAGTAPNLTYTPTTGYAGQDSFTFKANDGALDSIPASVAISVDRNPQAPIITSQPPALTVVLPSTGTNQAAVNFTPIELRPVDVGSTLTNKFSTLPTQNPAVFGLNGTDVRRVNFDTFPDGSAVPVGTVISNQYESVGVQMNNIPVSNNVYGGPASPPNATFISDGQHRFNFTVPVVAVGIINTSPDKDRIEYYSPQGVRLFDTRDTAPDSNTQYFVGARVNQGNLIGSVVITNVGGNDEFDELVFEVLTTQTFPGLFRYTVNATDPANLALTYSIAQGPSNMVMDSATGLLQWLPTGANVGPNPVTVRATNTLGLFDAQSFTINVVINAKPLVDAGPDRVVRSAGGSVQLLGSASDDGVPSTASFSMAWSVVSGPGTVTFSNTAIAQPTATFSAAGTYLLKLTAVDGLEESNDLVEVRVGVATLPLPSGIAAWWPANSHSSEIIHGNHDAQITNLGYLPGRVLQGFTFAGVSDSAVVTGHQDLDLSRDGQGITIEFWMQNPNTGGPDYPLFGWSNGGTPAVRASIVFNGLKPSWRLRDTAGNDYDGGTAGQIMTYGAMTHLAFTYSQLTGMSRIYHNGKLVLEQQLPLFTPRTDGDLWIGSLPGNTIFRGVMDEFTLYKRALNPAEIAAIYQAGTNGKMPPGINQGPSVNAGPDVSVASTSSTVSLNGVVTDDNQPFGAPTTAWAKVEGPGNVTFANSAAAVTTATFSTPGKYVLSLTATDNYTVPVTDVLEVRVGGGFLEPATGISAWWPANGDPREVVNGNHDIELLNGASYGTGRVSQGFRFLGTGDFGRTAAHADLNIGSSATGLTIEFWAQSTSSGTMLGWAGGANFYLVDGNRLGGNFREASGTNHDFDSYLWGSDVMWSGSGWNHFAITHDRVTGLVHFYQNGQRRHSQYWGVFALATTGEFQLGNGAFAGSLDEVTLYKRPLSAAEIAAIYQAGANGKSPPDDNLPPVVSAGPDRVIATIASSASLAGTVTDDNKPFGAPTITWSKVDGPGAVTFANASAASTTASFTAHGLYLLSLTATDNYTTPVSDVVEVRVGGGFPEPASGIAAWWPGNAEPREIVNGNHDIELINGAGYAAGRVSQAFRFFGTGDYGRTPAHADLNIGSSATGLTIEFWAQSTSSGTMLGWAGGANFYLVDGNRLGGNFREASGTNHDFDSYLWGSDVMWSGSGWNHFAITHDRVTGLVQFYQNGQRRHSQYWGVFALATTGEFQLGNGAFAGLLDEVTLYKRPLSAAEIMTIYQAGANGKCPPDENLPPVVSAGPDRVLASTAASASLAGVVTDDNKPFGLPIIAWSKVEGPGTVTFANAAAAATTATFSASGTYLLALTASDGLTNPVTDLVEVRVGSGYLEAPAGLSAWWPGNGEPREVINGSHDFELINGAGYGSGKVAQAFRFYNTGDFVQAAAHSDLNIGSSATGLTIEFWMNSGSTGRILGWGSGANFYLVDGNRFGGNFREAGGTDHEFDSYAWGGGVMWIGAGTWHHVAISYDRVAGEARFYQNGELRRVQNWGSFALATTGDFFLGGSFTGSVDEVSLYRRPLSAPEIAAIYNAGSLGKTVVPQNQAPIANAGPDLNTYTGVAVTLAGSATDDGLPNPPAALTYA